MWLLIPWCCFMRGRLGATTRCVKRRQEEVLRNDTAILTTVRSHEWINSPAPQLFVPQIVQDNNNNKKKSKAQHYWPFVRGIHQSLVDSPHKGLVMQILFPCHDVLCKVKSWQRSNSNIIEINMFFSIINRDHQYDQQGSFWAWAQPMRADLTM